jgi:hypothetical protein
MLLLSVLMFPAMVIRYSMGLYEMLIVDVPLFVGATLSVCSFYFCSQKELFPKSWPARLKYIPAVLSVGAGISVNNAKAVIEGFWDGESEFTRTPKYRIEGQADEWKQKRYKGSIGWVPYAELALGLYFTAMGIYALAYDLIGTLPFIMLFQFGFLYAGLLSLFQNLGFTLPGEAAEASEA